MPACCAACFDGLGHRGAGSEGGRRHRDDQPVTAHGKKHAAGGWYHFFHIDDIRAIAERWLYWEKQVRLNPQKYWRMVGPDGKPGGADHDILTGDAYVGHGQAPWISEMYGYVFAAAEVGVTHRVREVRRPCLAPPLPLCAPALHRR